MAEFHESWSLDTFICDRNTTNFTSSQAQDIKISCDKSKVSSSAVPISALESELVSSNVFEVTGTLGKCKPVPPKKESACEKEKKHKAMNLTRGI